MPILPHSTSFSLSLAPLSYPFPLLAAPPPRLLLPAPRIAGLLPATIPMRAQATRVKVEVVREEIPATFEELMAQIGPIRSAEEMDAEIVDMILAHRQRAHRDGRWDGSDELSDDEQAVLFALRRDGWRGVRGVQ
jgi:hypothetical protein